MRGHASLEDHHPTITYPADDTDFISAEHEYLSKVNEIAPTALGDRFLYITVDKTARMHKHQP